jgi:branched-chain amino acid transport system permease protein
MSPYIGHVVVIWAIFSSVAVPLALFSSRSGYLSLMQAVFFGLGAYSAAVMGNSGFGEPVLWIGTALLGGIVAWLMTALLFRTRADYFVVLTIALQSAATLIFTTVEPITNGPLGLPVRHRWPFGAGSGSDVVAALCILAMACIATMVAGRSSFARQLDAARQNDTLALVLGYNVAALRALAFACLCSITAVAGAAFAKYLAYIDPTSFRLAESIVFLTIIVIARMGGQGSVLLATAFFVGVPEILRFLRLEGADLANLQQIIFGTALVAVVLMRGRGSAIADAAPEAVLPAGKGGPPNR